LLFGGTPIEQDKPELSASFYTEQNPAEQAQPHPYQLFVFKDYQSPVTFDIKPNPIEPIMTSIPMVQTQVVADTIYWRPNEDQAISSKLPEVPGHKPEYLQH
jgi:hypothetical protein